MTRSGNLQKPQMSQAPSAPPDSHQRRPDPGTGCPQWGQSSLVPQARKAGERGGGFIGSLYLQD